MHLERALIVMRTKAVLVSLLVMLTVGCSGGQDSEFMLGQKLMLDMRYYWLMSGEKWACGK